MRRRSALLGLVAAFAGCGGGGSDEPRALAESPAPPPPAAPAQNATPAPGPAAEPQTARDPQAPAPTPNIAAFGDSFTYTFSTQLQLLYQDRNVFMGAEGGQNSTQIRDRLLAYPDKDRTFVIWAGRNNFRAKATVLADIAAMVAALPHDRFIVLPVTTADKPAEYPGGADYWAIQDLDNSLALVYARRFVDPRPALLAAADANKPQDLADVSHEVPPASLRTDDLHLNVPGQVIVARLVQARIQDFGW